MSSDNNQTSAKILSNAIHRAIMDTPDAEPEPLTSTAVLHIAKSRGGKPRTDLAVWNQKALRVRGDTPEGEAVNDEAWP